jgi:hypothetical protein
MMTSREFLGNEEHLKLLKQGVEVWNRWRAENPDVWPDLSGADLCEADLRGADLFRANLRGADLFRADLSGAHLIEADLSRAELSGANLFRADLSGANLFMADFSEAHFIEADLSGAYLIEAELSGVDMSRAKLRGADLSGAKLSGVDLSGATVVSTTFDNLDLSMVKGLGTVKHDGPSEIGISTIYRSHGQIPEAFLRGCGVPDNFIAYMGSLTGKAFEYYSCFISYSTKDQAFAERLHADLQAKGVRCWFAPEDISGGKKLYEQIDQAIRLHDKLLLVLSEHSIGSQWVMTEIRRTRKAELRDKRQKLFPIRLVGMSTLMDWECFDADSGKDLAVEVREYHIPDFSNWENHAAYKPAFDRLLRDLKAEEG